MYMRHECLALGKSGGASRQFNVIPHGAVAVIYPIRVAGTEQPRKLPNLNLALAEITISKLFGEIAPDSCM